MTVKRMLWNLPNTLTWLRIAAIPLIVWMAVGIWGFRNGVFWKP